MSADILIVDDEADIRELVAGILDDEGHRTRTAGSSDEALAAIEARRPHLVFLDIWLQGSRLDGLQVLDVIKAQAPDLPVVMISGHGNIETAVSAIKAGAYDFIEKPFKADRLILVAERALEASRLKREVRDLKARSGQASRIVGASVAANQLRQTVERVAPTNARVMISGAPGSGKELSARTIHAASSRANGPFVVINAATITPTRWRPSCSASRRPTASRAGSARWKKPMAAASTSTRSRTCPARPRTASCGSSSTRTSSASAAPPGSMSTCGSSRRRRAISRRKSPAGASARTCSIA